MDTTAADPTLTVTTLGAVIEAILSNDSENDVIVTTPGCSCSFCFLPTNK